jgi:hypothetical protein
MRVGQIAAGRADRLGEQHIGRGVALRALVPGHDAPVRRVFDARAEQAARLHHLVAGVVNGRGLVVGRPHERDLVHHRGQAGEDFRHEYARHIRFDRPERAANLGRGVGLHVPAVDLRRCPDEEQHNAVHVAIRGLCRSLGRSGLCHAQAEHRQGPGVKEITPADAAAQMDFPLRIEPDHGEFSVSVRERVGWWAGSRPAGMCRKGKFTNLSYRSGSWPNQGLFRARRFASAVCGRYHHNCGIRRGQRQHDGRSPESRSLAAMPFRIAASLRPIACYFQ